MLELRNAIVDRDFHSAFSLLRVAILRNTRNIASKYKKAESSADDKLPDVLLMQLGLTLMSLTSFRLGHFLPDNNSSDFHLNPSVPDAPNWRISAFEKRLH